MRRSLRVLDTCPRFVARSGASHTRSDRAWPSFTVRHQVANTGPTPNWHGLERTAATGAGVARSCGSQTAFCPHPRTRTSPAISNESRNPSFERSRPQRSDGRGERRVGAPLRHARPPPVAPLLDHGGILLRLGYTSRSEQGCPVSLLPPQASLTRHACASGPPPAMPSAPPCEKGP